MNLPYCLVHCCVASLIIAAWQKQVGDITYLTDKFPFIEDEDDPYHEVPAAEQRSKRAAVRNRYWLWKNGVIPYVISNSYTGNNPSIELLAILSGLCIYMQTDWYR